VTEFRPFFEIRDNVLHLHILSSDATNSSQLRCVLDLTDLGQVIGVEVLDLTAQLDGGVIAPSRSSGEIQWSYDAEIDALYIHVASGRGQVQRSVVANAELDDAGRIVEISVPLANK